MIKLSRKTCGFVLSASVLMAGAGPVSFARAQGTTIPPQPAPVVQDAPAAVTPADDPAAIIQKMESDPALAQAERPAEAPAMAPAETMPPAEDNVLMPVPTASAATSAASVTTGATAVTEGGEVPAIPALPPREGADENLFFDSENLVPRGEMRSAAPRKVNPATEPASKLIVVTKNHGAGSLQAKMVSAQRAIQLGRYDSALQIYEEAYAKNKRDPNVLLGRAVALQKMGQDESAIHAYEELLAVRPDNAEAQLNMVGLMGKRYPAVALQRLQILRDGNPDNVAIVAQMAVLQAEAGHYDEALQHLGTAAAMEPNNAAHVFNMAVIADRIGRKTDAIKYYEQALEIDAIHGSSRSIPRDSVFERLAQLR